MDEHIALAPGSADASQYERARRRQGLSNYRLVRFADDWYLAVSGTQPHAEASREEIAGSRMTGLRLSPERDVVENCEVGDVTALADSSAMDFNCTCHEPTVD
ncbi:hypothetical protein [Saccharopolyspora sp. 5N708]|uniref:hypothetical protein n=1 Tax=Saccharopolyspora sp. 5N708 TaxID=3457424 RepID=UPI003FD442BF